MTYDLNSPRPSGMEALRTVWQIACNRRPSSERLPAILGQLAVVGPPAVERVVINNPSRASVYTNYEAPGGEVQFRDIKVKALETWGFYNQMDFDISPTEYEGNEVPFSSAALAMNGVLRESTLPVDASSNIGADGKWGFNIGTAIDFGERVTGLQYNSFFDRWYVSQGEANISWELYGDMGIYKTGGSAETRSIDLIPTRLQWPPLDGVGQEGLADLFAQQMQASLLDLCSVANARL